MPRPASTGISATGPLSNFLNLHRKQVKAIQTHTRFDGDRVGTLSIPQDNVADLQRLLLLYVRDKSDSELGAFQGLNAISEKVVSGHPFRFFVDLDFKLSQLTDMGNIEVIAVMKRYISACLNTVTAAFGKKFRAVVTRRLEYKLHIHFPDLVVEKKTALALSQMLKEGLQELPLYLDDVLDQSVYSSGLRMLYCHKGALLCGNRKKDKGDFAALLARDCAAHEARFGKGSYQHVYEVLDCDTFEKIASRTIEHITDTSILPTAGQTKVTALPARVLTNILDGRRLVKGKGKDKRQSPDSRTGFDSEVPAPLQAYMETAFSVILNGKMKVFPESDSLALSTSNQQKCPFKQRKHKGNNVYIYVDGQGAGKRCHDADCKGRSHGSIPFDSFPSEVITAINELVNVAVVSAKESKLTGLSREMQRLKKDYPRNSFHIDPTHVSVDELKASIKMNDLYCPKCKKEHEDPLTFLECNRAGDVVLRCLKDFWGPSHPLTSVPRSVTNMLFQGMIQININQTVNNYEGKSGQAKGSRDFGTYQDFPAVFENDEINHLFFQSLAGDTYSVGKFLARIVKNEALYVEGKWYNYTGKYWRHCTGPNPFFAETGVGLYKTLMNRYTQESQVKWLQSIVSNLSNHDPRKPFIKELEGILDFSDEVDVLDSNTALVCFQNGVYDTDTCHFREHRKGDLITELIPYDLPTNSNRDKRKDIESFFTSIMPDEDTRNFLLLYLALHLEGRNRHQIAVILTGVGGNGKGMVKAIMKEVFGNLHVEPQPTFLTSERPSDEKPTTGLMDMRVKRSFFTSEPEMGKKINGGFLKLLSGGDIIRGCVCNSPRMVEYMPRFIPTLLCNTVPLIDCGNSEGHSIWRRLRIIHFPKKFVTTDVPLEANEELADPGLVAKIKTWGPEMMLMLTEIYRDYVANGRQLIEPPAVIEQIELQKLENNHLARFLSVAGRKETGSRSHVHYVKDRYFAWLRSRPTPLTDKESASTSKIGSRMKELGWSIGPATTLPTCTDDCQRKRSSGPIVIDLKLLPIDDVAED